MATAGAGAPAEATSSVPAGMLGVWNVDLKRSDAISPFLAEMGVPWLFRKLADSGSVTWTIVSAEGGFTQTTKNTMRTTTNTYKFGSVTEMEAPDGSKNRMTSSLLPGDKVQLGGAGPKGQVIATVYELVDGGAVLLATIDCTKADGSHLVVRRYFVRKP